MRRLSDHISNKESLNVAPSGYNIWRVQHSACMLKTSLVDLEKEQVLCSHYITKRQNVFPYLTIYTIKQNISKFILYIDVMTLSSCFFVSLSSLCFATDEDGRAVEKFCNTLFKCNYI